MADQVQEIKQKVDIVSVIGSRVELKKAGKYFKGLCPFHGEKSPSFFVSSEMQIYKCFGCGASGDVFTFLENYEGMTFREVLEQLAEQVGVELERFKPTSNDHLDKRVLEVLHLAKEYYHFLLQKHPAGKRAREYLQARKLPPTLAEQFELGAAPSAWDSLCQYLIKKKGYKPDEIVASGLAIKSQKGSVYDRFRDRLVFPLTDFRGRVVGFSGRVLGEAKEAKYINTPETNVYHKRELLFGISQNRSIIRKKDRVIVVEGEFDVLSSMAAGVRSVVGIKGSALTEEQIRLLMRLTKNVVLCLDSDSAGDEATKRGIELADRLGMNVLVLPLTEGKDPDELARSQPETWKKLVSKGISIYQFYINQAFERFDASTALGKKQIASEVLPILGKITNAVEQAFYLKQLAEKLQIREEVLLQELEKVHRKQELNVENFTDTSQPAKGDRQERTERYLWELWLAAPPHIQSQFTTTLNALEFTHPGLSRLQTHIHEALKTSTDIPSIAVITESLPQELKSLVESLYLSPTSLQSFTGEEIGNELAESAKELQKLTIKRKVKQLSAEIATLEDQEELNPQQQQKLEQKLAEYTRLISQTKLR